MKGNILSLAGAAVLAVMTAAGQSSAPGALPRLPDGKPNLNGYWEAMTTANFDIQDHVARQGAPGGQGIVEGNEIPYQPWALAKKKANFENRARLDSEAKCYQLGVPRITYAGHPFQIFQSSASDKVTILYEYAHTIRFIYTKNTTHPRGPIEWWMGDSRGTWDKDTFVVDNIHFNDGTWFDEAGNFHSEALHVVERYTLTDPDHITYEATIEDPKVFTKPWKISLILYRHKEKNFQLLDYECYAFGDDQSYPLPRDTP
jgi:hypothetical protein